MVEKEIDPHAIDELAKALQERGFLTKDTTPKPPTKVIPDAEPPIIAEKEQPEEEVTREQWLGFVADHLNDCPDCYKGLYEKVYKGDHLCVDCDLPLGSDKHFHALESCPGCGSTDAKRREE